MLEVMTAQNNTAAYVMPQV